MNAEQQQAAHAENGFVQIIAGPGTGKTRTLVERVCFMIESGIPPEKIVVMTFTNAAAREIRERVCERVSKLPGNSVAASLVVGTFHSVAFRFLKKYGRSFQIASATDQRSIISALNVGNSKAADSCVRRISSYKARHKEPTSTDKEFYTAFHAYNNRLLELKMYDFDDLLINFLALLNEKPQISAGLGAVLIDEFQDTNGIQLDIAIGLACHCRNLTVVGDPDQSIYSFRNAEPENFDKIATHGAQVKLLERNYRSTNGILALATRIVNQSVKRHHANRAVFANTNVESLPQLFDFPHAEREAEKIAHQICWLLDCGVFPREIAVLTRFSRYTSSLQGRLSAARVPLRVLGGKPLVERKTFRIVLDYLRVLCSENDALAIQRSISEPSRGIGPKTLEKLFPTRTESLTAVLETSSTLGGKAQKGVNDYLSFLNTCRQILSEDTKEALVATVERIASLILPKKAEDDTTRDSDSEWQLIDFILKMVNDIEDETEPDAEPRTYLQMFVDTWSLGSANDTTSSNGAVTIGTIHSSKGLEWPIVFVIGCNADDYNFALSRASSTDECADEERRLLYVATTRAQLYLSVSYLCGSPSPLLPEMAVSRSFNHSLEALTKLLGRDLCLNPDTAFSRPIMRQSKKKKVSLPKGFERFSIQPSRSTAQGHFGTREFSSGSPVSKKFRASPSPATGFHPVSAGTNSQGRTARQLGTSRQVNRDFASVLTKPFKSPLAK